MIRRATFAVVITAMAAFGAAGCSTSTSHPEDPPSPEAHSDTSASPSASVSPSASASPSGSASPSQSPSESTSSSPMITDPALPPIPIDGPGTEKVKVGDTLNVVTADVTEVSTDNGAVLQVSQPSDDGSAQFNAGAEVVGAGKATLTVNTADGESYKVKVEATEKS